MRSLLLTALSGVALLGFSVPAMAHPNDGDDQHEGQHDQINDQHAGTHDQLNDIHSEAHEEGLSRREHRRLHRALDRAHERADGNLEAQHEYQHQYGQSGYGGYNNGYGNAYGAPQSYYSRGYGYRGSRARHHRYNPYRGY